MSRPIWVHEFGVDIFSVKVHEKVKPDFLKICDGEEIQLDLED